MAQAEKQLRFRQDGSFHIMVVGDIHEKNIPDDKSCDYEQLIHAALDELQPDLAIFMGDILSSNITPAQGDRRPAIREELREGVNRLVAPFASRGVKLALAFGNHDGEGGLPKEVLFSLFQEHACFLCTNTANTSGVGDCNLSVKSSSGERDALNLWFVDSGNRAPKGLGKYALVQKDQIDWYEQTAKVLAKNNGGEPVPAMLFQHIPVCEEYALLKKASILNPYRVRGHGRRDNAFYTLDRKKASGYLGEGPCTPDYNSGQFVSWKRVGDVFAAFFGHDHMNDFMGQVEDIWLVQNKCAGFHIYGDGLKQGVRSVVVHENTPREFTTRMVRFRDFFGTKSKSVIWQEKFPDRWHLNFKAGAAILGAFAALVGLVCLLAGFVFVRLDCGFWR